MNDPSWFVRHVQGILIITMVHSLMIDDHGFPHGYFVIRSVATNRLLDVQGDCVEDGTEIVLWPEKEGSLVEGPLVPIIKPFVLIHAPGFRDPNANNQVFFIDTAGFLCSRSSGHAVDIEGVH